jgi:hypothetical protein
VSGEYVGLVTFVLVVGAMVWIAWMSWRRSQYGGISEVSATDQAQLAQAARALFADSTIASSPEFDSRFLGLLDSVERNLDDIDARLQDLRAFLKGTTMWDRFKDKQKLGLVYSVAAADLARAHLTPGLRQLLADWRMVGTLGSGSAEISRVPKSWIRPLASDPGGAPPTPGYKPGRKVATMGRTGASLVAGFTFSVSGAMISSLFTHNPLTIFEWFLGIFLVIVILYRTPLIRMK